METSAEQESKKSRERGEPKEAPETDVVSFEGKEGEVVYDATAREGATLLEQSTTQAKGDQESAEAMESMLELADIGEVTDLNAMNVEASSLPKQEQAAQAALINEAKRTTENADILKELPGVEDLVEIGDRDAAVQPQDLIEIGDFTAKRERDQAAAEAANKLEFAGTNWVELPEGEEGAEGATAQESVMTDEEKAAREAEAAALLTPEEMASAQEPVMSEEEAAAREAEAAALLTPEEMERVKYKITPEQLAQVKKFIDSGQDVMIKRGNGQMQKGKARFVRPDLGQVMVDFVDPQDGKDKYKPVSVEEFLAWQMAAQAEKPKAEEEPFSPEELAALDKAGKELLEKSKQKGASPEAPRKKQTVDAWTRSSPEVGPPGVGQLEDVPKAEPLPKKLSRWAKAIPGLIKKFYDSFGLK